MFFSDEFLRYQRARVINIAVSAFLGDLCKVISVIFASTESARQVDIPVTARVSHNCPVTIVIIIKSKILYKSHPIRNVVHNDCCLSASVVHRC